MGNLPIWRMIGLALGCAFVSSAAGFAVCLATHVNELATVLTTLVILVVSMSFVMRWWLGVCRDAGVDTTVKITHSRSLLGGGLVAVVLAGATIDFFAFVLFHDRFVQSAIALAIAVPAALVVGRIGYAMQGEPRANEAQLLRLTTYTTLASCVVLGASVIVRLTSLDYPDLTGTRNLFIALGLMVVPMMPVQSYYTWRRYLRARDVADLTTTAQR